MINFTNITDANTTFDMLIGVTSTMSNGLFWWLTLFAFGVVVFINLSFYGSPTAFASTSFMLSIMSLMMWIAGLLPLYGAIVGLVLLAISIMLMKFMG